ncbi:MAG: depupylase/deamidase Dop [Brachybacterium sp.]|nr:depupylase/deamidase Dop [Brachybacterium sp.]
MSATEPNPTAGPLTTRRPMGLETEFGVIHADAEQRARTGAGSSIQLSHLTVAAYALLADTAEDPTARGRRVRWDYGDETPLQDARGFEVTRAAAHPTQLTDQVKDAHVPSIDLPSADLDAPLQAPEVPPEGASDGDLLAWALHRSIGNAVLTNGARLYVDHAHPEYSSPEVMSAREAVIWDRAGVLIAREAMRVLEDTDGVPAVVLYKNNTDGKGASYGTHENYLLERAVPFDAVIAALVPFFASRQVITGAGRVGRGTRGDVPGFQISSRADFFEAEVGLETTLNRPLVNTRDEPHGDPARFRRLHVIIGDATQLHTATFLKLGMTSLVLAALEREHRTGEQILPRIRLADPVAATHAISHDPTLRRHVPLADGGSLTGLEIQRAYAEAIAAHAATDDEETQAVTSQWLSLLEVLARDPREAADRVEWAAKLALLEGYKDRHGIGWEDPRLAAIDLQFSDLRPARSLYEKLRAAGRVRTLIEESAAEQAMRTPPESTRAHLRGHLIRHHRDTVPSAGWDVLTLADGGHAARVRLADPRIGSGSWCARHGVDPAADADEIIAALRAAMTATPDHDEGDPR